MIAECTSADYTAGHIAANLEDVRRRTIAAALRADREREGHDRGQTLGDDGHGDRDRLRDDGDHEERHGLSLIHI